MLHRHKPKSETLVKRNVGLMTETGKRHEDIQSFILHVFNEYRQTDGTKHNPPGLSIHRRQLVTDEVSVDIR